MGWLLCFVLILVMLIGRQFSTGEHDAGYAAKKTPSITRTAPRARAETDDCLDMVGESEAGDLRQPIRPQHVVGNCQNTVVTNTLRRISNKFTHSFPR